MPAKKGNKSAQRSTDGPSAVNVLVRVTLRERSNWQNLADALQVNVSQLVRAAVEDYRMKAIGAGLKLKR